MKAALTIATVLLSVSAVSAFDAYPAEYPCVDQNAAAGVLLIRDETRLSMATPVHFRSWNLINDEGLQSASFPCERLAVAGFCGEHLNGDEDYSLVSHLCPRSCGICPKGNSKNAYKGDGTFRAGTDQNDFMTMIYSGRDCNDAAKHGWNKLSCEKDAVVRALCGEKCPNNCQRMGWAYEDYAKPLKKIDSYQNSNNDEGCAGVPYNRCKAMKYGEAEDACSSWGAHLCTLNEIRSGVTASVWKHDHYNMDGMCSSHMRTWVNNDQNTVCGETRKGGDRTHGSIVAGDADKFECQSLSHENSPMCCFGLAAVDEPFHLVPGHPMYAPWICPCCETNLCMLPERTENECVEGNMEMCSCDVLVQTLTTYVPGDGNDNDGWDTCCFQYHDSDFSIQEMCPMACAKYGVTCTQAPTLT